MEKTITLKNRMREHRGRLYMSQRLLAEEVGVDKMTIGNYETGKTNPDIVSCLLIARVFGVKVEEVFALEGLE